MAKEVEQMNRFELMNEVERLRKSDQVASLQTQIVHLKHELSSALTQVAKLEKKLEFIVFKGVKPNLRGASERRTQAQGRRKPTSRRKRT